MNQSDITASHRSRLAFVYVRRSTQHQVLHHLESQRRQRSLHKRAIDLGWNQDLIRVVNEDLAQSAARCQGRTGFQNMVTEAALGNIGIIFAFEVSRLSRKTAIGIICSTSLPLLKPCWQMPKVSMIREPTRPSVAGVKRNHE